MSAKYIFLLLNIILVFPLIAQSTSNLLRHPSLNKDGSKIAFSFQGDIWVVSSNGGNASRLTVHDAYESFPKWSPDDKEIAFSGIRFGNSDIYTISSNGGISKRLTYHSSNDNINQWTKNNNLLFTTVREFNQIEREFEIFSISSKGGTEKRFIDILGSFPAVSPDGRYTAFIRKSNSIYREDYSGPANRELWIYDNKNKSYTKLEDFNKNDISPAWQNNNTLFFLSANSGRYNIYKTNIDDNGNFSSPIQITNFKDESVRNFEISGDGSKIVFEKDINIYLLNTSDNKFEKVIVNVSNDYRKDPYEFKTFTNSANEYSVSPNGKLSALVIRGEIFVTENDKDKIRAVNVSNHPYRDMNPVWLSDTTLIFASDRNGNQYDLFMVSSADPKESNLFKSLKHELIQITDTNEDELFPVVSPDGKKIVYRVGRGKLISAEINKEGKLSNNKILLDSWATPSGISWSPDSKWIAYSLPDLYFNNEIYIHDAENNIKPVNVSMHPRGDYSPVWSGDGSKLGFISGRNNRNNDIWFVWLNKADWEKTKLDWDYAEPKNEKKDSKKDKDSASTKNIKIDFEDIHERLVQVTSLPGDENNIIISKDGEVFYYTAHNSSAKGNDLYSIKWDGKDLKEITKGGSNPGGISLDAEGKFLYYFRSGGALNKLDVKSDKSESLPYSAKMKIDFIEERKQIFEEAWRSLEQGFYDPNFHGRDWLALKNKYKERCLEASTEEDFREMFNYMLGELNSSHMGFNNSSRSETQRESTGMLGVELSPVNNGMEILRVIPNTPADRETSKLYKGEIIKAVNGININNNDNFYLLLTNTVDEQLILTVSDKNNIEREVVIRPVNSIRSQLYEEWVKERKLLTEKYSNGKLGYIHIQGMNLPSFENFEREIAAAGNNKEGLVIDVRFNGGGWTTDYLMAVLNYKQHAYTIPRGATNNLERDHKNFRDYYPLGERLIYSAWTKPSISICNEDSYSNAEIFSHAFKTLGIGTLVGQPTNGSVISTGGVGLLDGSFVRMPFRAWYTKATDENQELGPAVPDILIENSPMSKSLGEDEQLKKAVEELLKTINY